MKKPQQKEARKSRPVRMTDAEWQKCKALGGAAFVRAKIKAAKVDERQIEPVGCTDKE